MTVGPGALRERDFRLLFLGQAASMVGDRAVVTALALVITARGGSATDLGLVLAAQGVPFVALLLFGGVIADRFPRQRIMLAADLVRAALHALLAALLIAGAASIPAIAGIEFVFGAAQAFFQPAYTGLLPQTVPPALVQQARGLTEAVGNLAFALGPALATVLVLTAGAATTFALDAASFLVSAVLLARLRPARLAALDAPPARSLAGELREGFDEVRARPWVWVTIVTFAVVVLTVYAPWYALAPGVARRVYGDVSVFGVLETISGVGAVAGSLLALRWRPRHVLVVGLLLTIGWPVESALLAIAAPEPVVAVGSVAAGFGFATLMVFWETALVRHIPPAALSRVSSYDWMGSLALMPFGYLLAGPLAGAFGSRPVLGAGAAVAFVMLLVAVVPRQTRGLSLTAGRGEPEPGPGSQPSSSTASSA